MADDKRDTPRPFDVKTIEHLLRLMSEHDLAEVELTEGDERIRLRKAAAFARPAQPGPSPGYPGAHTPGPPAPGAQPGQPGGHAPGPPAPAAPAKKYHEIRSELVGAFYTRPAPDKPEYVAVGSRVSPDTTVGLIIAMKVNNEVKAGVSGTVVEVVAKNEAFVDFDAVLIRVDPS